MSSLPTKRVLVYVVLGAVVLVVGIVAVVSMGGKASSAASEMTILDDVGGAPSLATTVTESPTTTQAPVIFVQVAGEVWHPGVYQMLQGERVFQAVEKAGGFTEQADRDAVALASQVSDGCRVYVPRVGEVTPDAPLTIQGSMDSSGTSAPVSINSASLEVLDALPGIGPATAQKIIAYREANGPFSSVDELTEVPGIGQAKLEELRPFIGL